MNRVWEFQKQKYAQYRKALFIRLVLFVHNFYLYIFYLVFWSQRNEKEATWVQEGN